jgi:uncharacterized protein (TIGR00369 family)
MLKRKPGREGTSGGFVPENNRSLSITWDDPHAAFAASKGLSGIEYMHQMIAGAIAVPPIMKLLDYRLARVAQGEAVFECSPGEQHYNPIGVVHGGLAMTLLDSAMGCAVHTTLPVGMGYTTLEVKVNLVRAITKASGLMRCTGKVIYSGKRIATAEARLEDASGKLYAHGTTTCMILNGN